MTERELKPLGHEVQCPVCHIGTIVEYRYPWGSVRQCTWCHREAGQ